MTRDEALAELREILTPGTTVRTILRHVSGSGMTRWISPVIVTAGGDIRDLSYLVRPVLGVKISERHSGVKVGGAGMDMGFSLVYSLSRALFPDGHPCLGERACPSNDHSNDYGRHQREFWETSGEEKLTSWVGDSDEKRAADLAQHQRMRDYIETASRDDYAPSRVHSDGGYALSQRWL